MKSYVSPSDRNCLAWLIFWVGMAFAPLAWILWFWRDGSMTDAWLHQAAWQDMHVLFCIGFIICAVAPFFGAGSLPQKISLSILGCLAGAFAAYLIGPLFFVFIAII